MIPPWQAEGPFHGASSLLHTSPLALLRRGLALVACLYSHMALTVVISVRLTNPSEPPSFCSPSDPRPSLCKSQKDPEVKAKLEMSNCHRCSGACPVPPTSVASEASSSCGGEIWHPAECHPQCQTRFASLPDAHLAPKHSPDQKCTKT